MISVRITRKENAQYYGVDLDAVVQVPLEDYVAGVVASEVGSPHIEAAKAQAVAARTHAWPYYSTDRTISDSSATNQAFRAVRINSESYPNAVKAAQETRGEVLFYNGKVISTCSYSASNGGQTTSSEERWGGFRAWLIAQPDPWDVAEGITTKTGHGVGMSQRGMKYAAKIGKTYQEILSFYYPGTQVKKEGEVKENTMGTTVKASDLVAETIRIYEQGWGYIWGTYGQKWTEALQKKGSKENNAKTQAYGRQWIGYNVSDCSGLPYLILKSLGWTIAHGSNSIWNSYLSEKGTISKFPQSKRYPGMPVFKTSGSNRHHIGTYIGGGWVIEAKGTQTGVVISRFDTWDEAGYYKNVEYDLPHDWQLPEFHFDIYPPLNGFTTCRSGSSGASVRYIQVLLHERWDRSIVVDNYFGSSTVAIVKAFQQAHGLTVDGAAGPLTLAALEKALPIGVDPDPVVEPDVIPDMTDHQEIDVEGVKKQLDIVQRELDKLSQMIRGV